MNPLSIRPDRLKRLRKMCLGLPQAAEKEAWGDPTWRIRDRIFAMQKGNTKGARPSLWLKAPPGAQAMLVDADPVRYFVPPYVGHQGWIGVYMDGSIKWDELAGLIEESFWMTAPKRFDATAIAAAKPRRKPKSS